MVCRWGLDASDPRWGDGHYYDYTGDCLDTRVYPRSKFVSEFGFQSYPSFNVLKNVTAAEDRSYTSSMMNYRCISLSPSATMALSFLPWQCLMFTYLLKAACHSCWEFLHHASMYIQQMTAVSTYQYPLEETFEIADQ